MADGRFDPKAHKTYRAVRSARELVGQSPAELAIALSEKLGEEITVDIVYNIEVGRKKLTPELLRAISEIHGLNLEWYVYGPVNSAKGVYTTSTLSMAAA